MMRSFCFLLASALVPSVEAAPPARVDIAYEISREGTPMAEVVARFEHGDGRYRIVETWRGRGLYSLAGEVVRSSHGTVGPDGLRPVEFTDVRSRRAPARADFDWAANTVTLQRKGESRTEALPPNPQDRVSFLYALAFAPPRRHPVTFGVTDGGGISQYVFDRAARERVKVPAGEFDALKVARRPEDANDRRVTEIWLARALGGLPVRILLVDRDGARIDQQAVNVAVP
jgi:hypothetical protein